MSKLDLVWRHRVTLVGAPAGYGKTTAVLDWLGKRKYQAAWLTLDAYDNKPRVFWEYVITALENIIPDIKNDTEYILRNAELLSANIHIDIIVDRLSELDSDFILVLDDTHSISNPAILNGISRLIDYMPRKMHLLLISRTEPELELAKYRIKWQMHTIDEMDLRFEKDDILRFFQARSISLDDNELKQMENYTEGWIASLVAIAMTLGNEKATRITANSLSSLSHDITRYLKEEVVSGWSEDKLNFAMETSVLDTLSAEVCDAVTGSGNARRMLGELFRDNGFLVVLDEADGLYRYHYIFKDFLLQLLLDLNPTYITILHARAGDWYRSQGVTEKAVEHFLSGGLYEDAIGLIENKDIIHSYEYATLVSWLERLPMELRDNSFFAAYIYSLYYTQKEIFDLARTWHVKMEVLAALPYYTSTPAIIAFCNTACLFNKTNLLMREGNSNYLAHFSSAVKSLDKKYYQFPEFLDFNTSDIYFYRCPVCVMAKSYEEDSVKFELSVKDYRNIILKKPGYKFLVPGEYLYENNKLDEALPYLLKAMEEAKAAMCFGVMVPAMVDLARIKRAKGDMKGAFEALEECKKALTGSKQIHWYISICAFCCRLYLDAGSLDKAEAWLSSCKLSIFTDISKTREFELLVFARVLICKNNLEDAEMLLQRLLIFMEKTARTHSKVEALNLLAILENTRGRHLQAVTFLDQSLCLGRENQYIRSYLDEGVPMKKLLSLYLERKSSAIDDRNVRFAGILLEQMKEIPSYPQAKLIENLTSREKEILDLLLDAYTNKEISDKLGVALQTVKIHIGNIYGKLGVKSRTQCLRMMRDMRIAD